MDSIQTILVAEDDEADRLLGKRAMEKAGFCNDLCFVKDGEELMDYLYRRGPYIDYKDAPYPAMILLDLNMPKKSGFEALEEIKADPELHTIPVVILTGSEAEEDICRANELEANDFITKPRSFGQLVTVMEGLKEQWLELR